MITLSNPRLSAVIENWPSGRKRVTATFLVESKIIKGVVCQRGLRSTTGKPKATTYYPQVAIVDGSDGKTYFIAGTTEYGQRLLIPGTMQFGHQYFTSGPEWEQIGNLLAEAWGEPTARAAV